MTASRKRPRRDNSDGARAEQIRAILGQGAWFASLPQALKDAIVDNSAVRSYAQGQVISQQDVVPKGYYAVLEGEIRAVRMTEQGDETALHVGNAGFWFGDMVLLAGALATVTVVAQTPVRLLLLPRAQFERIVGEHPDWYREFARLTLERYAMALLRLADNRGPHADQRLRRRLFDLVAIQRRTQAAGKEVTLAITQKDLASLVGVGRQRINVLLAELKAEGLIEIRGRKIRVLDPGALMPVTDPR